MDTTETTRSAAVEDWPRQAETMPGSPALAAALELEVIVGRARRRTRLRRAFSHIGARFARWLDNLAPPAPTADDHEPLAQIRFPFF